MGLDHIQLLITNIYEELSQMQVREVCVVNSFQKMYGEIIIYYSTGLVGVKAVANLKPQQMERKITISILSSQLYYTIFPHSQFLMRQAIVRCSISTVQLSKFAIQSSSNSYSEPNSFIFMNQYAPTILDS